MNHIQRAAEDAVREMFKKKAAEISKDFTDTICGSDYLDDGSLIALRVKFDAETGEADFDFSCVLIKMTLCVSEFNYNL